MTTFRKKSTLRPSHLRNSLRHESLEARQLLAFDFAGTAAFSQADLTNDGVLDHQDIDSLAAGLRSGSQTCVAALAGVQAARRH